jgi:hypothetical protein
MNAEAVRWLHLLINESVNDDTALPAFQSALLSIARRRIGTLNVADDDLIQEFCASMMDKKWPPSWKGLSPEALAEEVSKKFLRLCERALKRGRTCYEAQFAEGVIYEEQAVTEDKPEPDEAVLERIRAALAQRSISEFAHCRRPAAAAVLIRMPNVSVRILGLTSDQANKLRRKARAMRSIDAAPWPAEREREACDALLADVLKALKK